MDTIAVDQEWLGWLHGLLSSGADALGVDLVGEPVLGLRGRSIGCRAATSERVSDTFADILTGPGAAVAHLAAAAKLLRLVEYGDHSDLALPLHRHARTILAT